MKKICFSFFVLISICSRLSAQTANYSRNDSNDPSPGTENVTIGNGAGGLINSSSNRNVLLGRRAGMNALFLQRSVLIGARAGAGITNGVGQIIIGDSIATAFNGNIYNPNTLIGIRAATGVSEIGSSVVLGNDILNSSTQSSSANVLVGGYIGRVPGTANPMLIGNTVLGMYAANRLSGHYSTYIGFSAGSNGGLDNTDNFNTAVGAWAGAGANNRNNTFLGAKSGQNASGGSDNLMIGIESGYNFHQAEAIIIGKQAAYNPTNSSYIYYGGSLITIGNKSAYNYMGGMWNVFLGNEAAYNFTGIGSNGSGSNTLLGSFAGRNLQSGESNTFVGTAAGLGKDDAITYSYRQNVLVGDSTGVFNAASGNTFVGSRAGSKNVWGMGNTFIGKEAGYRAIGQHNTFLGAESGRNLSYGENNTFIGENAGKDASGYGSVIIGSNAGVSSAASNNTFIGTYSGSVNKTGSDNTLIGFLTADELTGGNSNTALGSLAGRHLQNGMRNTFIGSSTGIARREKEYGPINNATAIGAAAEVGVSYGVVLGDTVNAKVGIGTAFPNQRLTIRGNIGFLTAANLRLDNAPFLDVNPDRLALGGEKGEFPVEITSSLHYRVADASRWADYVFDETHRPLSLRETAAFIRANKHLPGVPSAADVVKNGVDAARMDAKLLEKIEELTLHTIEQETRLEKLEKENAELRKMVMELVKKK